MLEIESKYPVPDLQALEVQLQQLGAFFVEERSDADHYLNAPDRDFAVTDEAFRLRRIGQENFLTWKGPKLDRETKTRREIEVAVASGEPSAEQLLLLFQALGYRHVAVVKKRRRILELKGQDFQIHFCLDNVAQVGTFAEIEIMAEEADFAAAKAVLQAMAQELGLPESERRSYLQMLLRA